MQAEREKQIDQVFKYVFEANRCLDEFAQTYGDKILEYYDDNYDEQGLIDVLQKTNLNTRNDELNFEDDTSAQNETQRQGFFQQIPNFTIDQQIEEKILNFKLNFVSAKRKDELFKRHRKQQEEKLTQRKRDIESRIIPKFENFRNIKGQFTLKKGEQSHTCSITGDDLQKLRPQTDLNDTIIANYLKYLQTEVFSEQIDKNLFIYSSFFIEKLIGELLRQDYIYTENPKILSEKIRLKAAQNYKNIKRWTRKVDIFDKEHLIIPINALKHWNCMIVVNPGAVIDPKSTNKKPCILYCDSMFDKRPFVIDAIRTQFFDKLRYLQVELEDKKSMKIDINEQNFPCYQLLLPRQTNTHDCGLYMLTYIQHLISNKEELENIDLIQNRQKLHIFPRSLIFSMRERLKDLFINLIQTADENARKEILRRYREQTEKIIKEADENDYDKINIKEFKKYETMNSHLIDSNNFDTTSMSDEEIEYIMKIKFYLDPEVNFYERDKPFLM